jgi:hypothetical protein
MNAIVSGMEVDIDTYRAAMRELAGGVAVITVGMAVSDRQAHGMAHVCLWPMLSKKSFWGTEQIFLEALMRWSENDVGGHMISRISNRQPS